MNKGKYIVVAPVLCNEIILLRRKLQDAVRNTFGEEGVRFLAWEYGFNSAEDQEKDHITLGAPLYATYERASELNMALDMFCMKFHDEGIGLRATLNVGPLTWFRNDNSEDILVMKVSCDMLEDLARRVRHAVDVDDDMEWCNPLPGGGDVNLHITVCSGKGIFERLNTWVIQQSTKPYVVGARVLFPMLLARYPSSWRWLSHDPTSK